MEAKSVINMRGIDCPPELEEKFNKWYEETHIPMLLKTGEVRSVTRYKRAGDDGNYPKYLAVYEFENQQAFEKYKNSPEMVAALEDVKKTWPDKKYESKWSTQYEAMRTWKG
ncbi:EthD family reductase [Chloroflexota bacterium]